MVDCCPAIKCYPCPPTVLLPMSPAAHWYERDPTCQDPSILELIFHAAQLDADPVRILQHYTLDFRRFRKRILIRSRLAPRKPLLHYVERTVNTGPRIDPDREVINTGRFALGD